MTNLWRAVCFAALFARCAFAAADFPSELPKGVKPWTREPAVNAAFLKGKNGDMEGAIAALRPLAAAGNVQAQGQLANYQAIGRGMKRDVKAGCKAAREAYDRGAVNASSGVIGCLYEAGLDGSTEAQQEAARIATEAWEKHRYVFALGYIGLMQESGVGMKADPAAAERTYRLAIKYGDETSAYSLGELMESGKVGKRSFADVTNVYRYGALRMHGPAMMETAKRLSQRKETLQEALAWAALADAANVAEAKALLRDIHGKLKSADMKPDRAVYDRVVGEMAIVALTPTKEP